jgi:hypothetical protein
MRRVFGGALVVLLATLAVAAPSGCGGKDEGKPNPALKIPDVPPSTRGKGGAGAPVPPPQ